LKYEELTDFLIDWGDGQQLRVQEGIAVATQVLRAGPLPVQIGTTSSTYMALGKDIPAKWLTLFDKSHSPAALHAEVTYHGRTDQGFLSQTLSLAPCEQGEHLHATVIVSQTIHVGDGSTAETLSESLYEAWRSVGDAIAELQEEWVLPFLEQALAIEELHGGAFR